MNTTICPTRPLIRMRESASIQEAAQLMCDMSMGALGVDDHDHEFLGLITERDLLWALAQGKDHVETKLGEMANDFPIVVDGPISAEEAAKRMTTGHIRHLLILIDGVLNIVSLRDLMATRVRDAVSEIATRNISESEMRRMFGIDEGRREQASGG